MANKQTQKQEKLTESLEKYLLAVYEIVRINKAARVKDVSNYLKIGGPATSDAIKTLAKKGFINYEPYGIITLTLKGKRKAEEKILRHRTIKGFFTNVLMIEEESAETNSKIMEYSMTDDVLERFTMFLDFMQSCSCKEPKWVKSCQKTLENGKMSAKCQNCISGCSKGCSCCK